MTFDLPKAKSVADNPTQDQMRAWAREYLPRVARTRYGNLNYTSIVTARQAPSTFFVSDEPTGKPVMPRAEYERWAARQDAYVAEQDMILIEGYIGPDPAFRTGARLLIDKRQANIPAMQQQLYFAPDADWEPEFTIVYTPGLLAPGRPAHRLICVDLDNYVTRVFGSDYFGESKMGGLRMWNRLVYERGGLAMHAGAKVFPADRSASGEEELALIIGLSGTGKTTTTFRQVRGSLPVQDDFIGLMSGGEVHATEAGCFAKTFGLHPDDEPTIWEGATAAEAWLENNAVDVITGRVDFDDGTYTRNGRATLPLADIRHREPRDLPTADYLLILNRNESIIPAVARLKPEQAAYYFMLGETKGTSAGGAAEAGKSLRVPGTNPFWFEGDASQGDRLLELLETCDLEVYLLNTGRVGGSADHPESKSVQIRHSAAVQEAIVDGTGQWVEDPDFGYEIATQLPGIDDPELLCPRRLYERTGRTQTYEDLVAELRQERAAELARYDDLDPRVLRSDAA